MIVLRRREWRLVLGNLTIKVVLGGLSELTSMKYTSELIGGHINMEGKEKRYFNPEDLRVMHRKRAIVVFDGGHMVVKKSRWFDVFEDE